MSVSTEQVEYGDFDAPTLDQLRDAANLTIKLQNEYTWARLTCDDMEAVINSHDHSDGEMICSEKKGQWVKFHIPEEGEFGAHVNGL